MQTNLQYTPERVRALISSGSIKFPESMPAPPDNLKGKKRDDFARRMKLTEIYFKHKHLSATQIGVLPTVHKLFGREVSRALVNFHVGNAIDWLMSHGKFVDKDLAKASRKVSKANE